MRLLRDLKLPCVIGLAVVAVGGVATAQAETVKVGVVLPLSGVFADVGQTEVRAMKLYIELHKSELGDNSVELIERDSKEPSGATAQTLSRELVVQDKVDVLVGYQFSPDAIASADIATRAKKLMILVNAQSSFLTTLSPYIVRLSTTIWQISYPAGQYAHDKLGCKSMVVGYTDFAPGRDVMAAVKAGYETAGGTLMEAVPIGGPAQVPDYTPFLQRIKNETPGCMYVFTPAANFNQPLVRTYNDLQMKEAGIGFLATGDVSDDATLQQLGDGAVGLTTFGHYTADLDTPENKTFIAAWHQAYGDKFPPDFFAVQAYDSMAALFHVIKTLDGHIDADKAVAALAGWHEDSPRGPIMIDPETRDIVQNIYVQRIEKQDGRLVMKILDTIPAVKDPCKALHAAACAPKAGGK